MEKYFFNIERIYDLSLISYAIPVIVAIFRWKFFNLPMKIAAINALRALIIISFGLYLSYTNHNNQFLFYLSPCLDIILISLLAVAIFDFRKELNWVLTLLCVIFIGLMINDYLTSKTLLSSLLSTVETIFVIILLILMLRKVVLTFKSSTYKRSLIWIFAALLIMNLFSILISTLMETFSEYSNKFMQLSWYLSSPLFIVITNLMVAYGFYIIDYKVKEK
jgi:uncharacterized membrane protein